MPAGLPPPTVRPSVPRLITFQRKRANRRIINEEEVVELLKTYGPLEVCICVECVVVYICV